MFDVAIIGAGELGGATAFRLASHSAVGSVLLVDESAAVASGKALDIMQAAPIAGSSTTVSGRSDIEAASRASVVVIADRVTGGEWRDEEGLALLKRVAAWDFRAIVCAGAAQRALIEHAARELRIPRERIFGSAPEALASAVRAAAALEAGGSARDVALTVLGVPPTHLVVPWEDATIAGLSASRWLDTPTRRRIEQRAAGLWPPGPHALAAAAGKAIRALTESSRAIVTGFVAPDDSAGRRMRAAAFPVRLGLQGIVEVVVPPLSAHDRVALDTAVLL